VAKRECPVKLLQEELSLCHGRPPEGKRYWVTLLGLYPIEYRLPSGDVVHIMATPQFPAFWYDLASSPSIAWALTLSPGEYGADRASTIHDYAYDGLLLVEVGPRVNRLWMPVADADQLLCDVLEASGRVSAWRRAKVFAAVRAYSVLGPGRNRYVGWDEWTKRYPDGVAWDSLVKGGVA